jgi:hypothetical protein
MTQYKFPYTHTTNLHGGLHAMQVIPIHTSYFAHTYRGHGNVSYRRSGRRLSWVSFPFKTALYSTRNVSLPTTCLTDLSTRILVLYSHSMTFRLTWTNGGLTEQNSRHGIGRLERRHSHHGTFFRDISIANIITVKIPLNRIGHVPERNTGKYPGKGGVTTHGRCERSWIHGNPFPGQCAGVRYVLKDEQYCARTRATHAHIGLYNI